MRIFFEYRYTTTVKEEYNAGRKTSRRRTKKETETSETGAGDNQAATVDDCSAVEKWRNRLSH